MSMIEKYNSLIETVEKFISEEYPQDADKIAEQVSMSAGMRLRDISTIFKYITELSLISYIKDRKMIRAYKILMDNGYAKTVKEKMVIISGYDGDPSFLKAFKKKFNATLMEAAEEKDLTKIEPPLVWSQIVHNDTGETGMTGMIKSVGNVDNGGMNAAINEMISNRINPSVIAIYQEIEDLHAAYGLDEDITTVACQLVSQTNKALKDAFKYVAAVKEDSKSKDFVVDSDIDWVLVELWEEMKKHRFASRQRNADQQISELEKLRIEAFDPGLIHLYFDGGIDVAFAQRILFKLWKDKVEDDITKMDPLLARLFGYTKDCAFVYIKECFKYMKKMYDGDDSTLLAYYAKYLDENTPMEIALEKALEDADFDEMSVDEIIRLGNEALDEAFNEDWEYQYGGLSMEPWE